MLQRTLSLLREEWLLVLILGVTALLRVPSLSEPLWYGDEAVYLTIGQQLLRGDLLYADVFDHKPPALYYLTAGSLAVFGHSVAAIKLLAFGSSLTALVVVYFLARRLLGKPAALLGVVVLSLLITPTWLEGNIAGSEIVAILPTCAGMLLGMRRQFLLAGCAFGLAFLLRVPAVFDFGAFFLFAALSLERGQERRTLTDLGKLSGGFLAPFLFTVVFFAAQGALDEYIDAAFMTGVDYTSGQQADGRNDFLFSHGRLVLNGVPVLLLVAFLSRRTLHRRRSGERAEPGSFAFLLLWLGLSFYGVLLGGRPYEHYLIQAAPPFALLLAFVLTRRDSRAFVGAGALLIVLGIAVNRDFDVAYRRNWEYYLDYSQNFIDYAADAKGFEEYADHFDPRTARNYRIASFLDSDSGERDELLYVFSDQPAIYFRSRLDPAARFVFFYHLEWKEAWVRETKESLAEKAPLYIVTEEPRLREFLGVEQAIKEDYRLFASDGILRLYKRRD